jgi:hypothetical protein
MGAAMTGFVSVTFTSRELRDRFSRSAIAALRETHPRALAEVEAAA